MNFLNAKIGAKMEKIETANLPNEELIKKVKVLRNLIVSSMQIVPSIENRFKQKTSIDNTINLAKILTEVQNELAKRGIYTYE